MFILFLLILLFPNNVYSFNVTVKTLNEGKPVSSAIIKVWNKGSVIKKDMPDFLHKSDINGVVTLDMDRGEYYFFAEKIDGHNYFFGFFGQNPVSVRTAEELTINMVKYPSDYISKKKGSGISGIVYHNGKPFADVGVFAYLDLTSGLKGPAFLSSVTDDKGRFFLDLEEGSYYLIFRKKSEEAFGPPSPGDYIGFFPQFPLELSKNGYDIKVSLLKIPTKMQDNLKEKSFLIKGQVLGKNNLPKKGVYVVLYEDYTLLGKPDYVSHQTNEKGEFNIYVKKAGSYFVVLRKTLGDTPKLGEDVSSITEVKIEEGTTVKELLIKTHD